MQVSRYIAVASFIAGAVFAADDPLACRAFTTEWTIDPAQNIGQWSHDVGEIDATRAYYCRMRSPTRKVG